MIIRNPKIVQVLLKLILRRQACVSQITSLPFPFLQAAIVKQLRVLVDDKRNDVVSQTFLEQNQPTNSAVAVLKWVNPLKTVVKIKQIIEGLFLIGVVF